MSNAITRPPSGASDYGHEFNYAVWAAGTRLTLARVPWDQSYRDIAYFSTQAALDAYIDSKSGPGYDLTQASYAKPGHSIRVNIPFNRVIQWNYIRATNAAQPIPNDVSRSFYYFITDVRYIAPMTTEIVVQLDVWTTYSRDVSFGNCYIERGHIGIANSNQMAGQDFGREWLTVPEGLDVGNEYVVAKTYEHTMVDLNDPNIQLSDMYGVIIASTTKLMGDYGNVDNPRLESATGSLFERLPNGCEIYYFDNPGSFTYFQLWISQYPWVAQGIISVTVVPRITGVSLGSGSRPSGCPTTVTMYEISHISKIPDQEIKMADRFRDDFGIPARYANLKKLLVYPYSVIELTTYSGTPLVLKPECINTNGFYIRKMTHLAPPNPRITVFPKSYNATATQFGPEDGEFLDMATGIFDLPTFSIVNNGYMQYMASQRNAIAYQYSSADWSQTRALNKGINAFNQDNKAIDAMGGSAMAQRNASTRSMALANSTMGWRSAQSAGNAILDGIGSAAGGNVAGGIVGAVRGGANAAADYAIGSNQNFQQNAISNQLNMQQTDLKTGVASFNRDTNYAYANMVAKGDYQNDIAGINARVQDAKLLQPTTSGQIGGDAFMLASYKWGVWAKLKTLQPAVMRSIAEYWLRYGYSINTFGTLPADYQCMENFTYWKLKETYLKSGTCPESFKQTIRGIFEKGVTVWNNPAKIGNIDMADNTPRAGVTL